MINLLFGTPWREADSHIFPIILTPPGAMCAHQRKRGTHSAPTPLFGKNIN
jgi:hypothetical protein